MTAPSLLAFEVVVALAAVQRLLELLHSRRNLARLAPGSRAADSRGNFGALVVFQVLWLGGCALEPWWRGRVSSPGLFALGCAAFLCGAALRAWCILRLGGSWNARARVDPGLSVVSSGPYRWVRHPNYLGVLLELFGLPLCGGALWTLLLLAPPHLVVLARRIRGEDALLFALPGYAEAMGRKGALLPRVFQR